MFPGMSRKRCTKSCFCCPTVKQNPLLTTVFICQMHVKMYKSHFVPFLLGNLPTAYFLYLAFFSVPLTELNKAVACERLFLPSCFHHNLHQGERQSPLGLEDSMGALLPVLVDQHCQVLVFYDRGIQGLNLEVQCWSLLLKLNNSKPMRCVICCLSSISP